MDIVWEKYGEEAKAEVTGKVELPKAENFVEYPEYFKRDIENACSDNPKAIRLVLKGDKRLGEVLQSFKGEDYRYRVLYNKWVAIVSAESKREKTDKKLSKLFIDDLSGVKNPSETLFPLEELLELVDVGQEMPVAVGAEQRR